MEIKLHATLYTQITGRLDPNEQIVVHVSPEQGGSMIKVNAPEQLEDLRKALTTFGDELIHFVCDLEPYNYHYGITFLWVGECLQAELKISCNATWDQDELRDKEILMTPKVRHTICTMRGIKDMDFDPNLCYFDLRYEDAQIQALRIIYDEDPVHLDPQASTHIFEELERVLNSIGSICQGDLASSINYGWELEQDSEELRPWGEVVYHLDVKTSTP